MAAASIAPVGKLYVNYVCPFAQRALITAAYKHVSLEIIEISLKNKPEWYKDINPRGTVPAMKLNDGQMILESMFIAEYLDASFGAPHALMPRHPQTRAEIRFFLNQAGELIDSLYGALMAKDEDLAANVATARSAVAAIEGMLAKQSNGPFFLGTQFSLADVALVPFVFRFSHTLAAYCDYDLKKEAPRMQAMLAAAMQIDAVAATTPPVARVISGYASYAKRPAAAFTKALPVLYVKPHCPYCERAKLAAAIQGVAVTLHDIAADPVPEATWKALSPNETVPILALPSGAVVRESMYIAKFFGESAHLQDPVVAAPIVPADALTAYKGDILVDDFNAVGTPLYTLAKATDENRQEMVAGLTQALEKIEAQIVGPFALGAAPSFADCGIVPTLLRIEAFPALDPKIPAVLGSQPKLTALLAAVKAHAPAAAAIQNQAYYVGALQDLRSW